MKITLNKQDDCLLIEFISKVDRSFYETFWYCAGPGNGPNVLFGVRRGCEESPVVPLIIELQDVSKFTDIENVVLEGIQYKK